MFFFIVFTINIHWYWYSITSAKTLFWTYYFPHSTSLKDKCHKKCLTLYYHIRCCNWKNTESRAFGHLLNTFRFFRLGIGLTWLQQTCQLLWRCSIVHYSTVSTHHRIKDIFFYIVPLKLSKISYSQRIYLRQNKNENKSFQISLEECFTVHLTDIYTIRHLRKNSFFVVFKYCKCKQRWFNYKWRPRGY